MAELERPLEHPDALVDVVFICEDYLPQPLFDQLVAATREGHDMAHKLGYSSVRFCPRNLSQLGAQRAVSVVGL